MQRCSCDNMHPHLIASAGGEYPPSIGLPPWKPAAHAGKQQVQSAGARAWAVQFPRGQVYLLPAALGYSGGEFIWGVVRGQ